MKEKKKAQEPITIKKTVYLDKELIKEIKIKAVHDETTESKTLNSILEEYFKVANC